MALPDFALSAFALRCPAVHSSGLAAVCYFLSQLRSARSLHYLCSRNGLKHASSRLAHSERDGKRRLLMEIDSWLPNGSERA